MRLAAYIVYIDIRGAVRRHPEPGRWLALVALEGGFYRLFACGGGVGVVKGRGGKVTIGECGCVERGYTGAEM